MFVDQPDTVLKPWVAKLESAADTSITTLNDLIAALKQRHDFFHSVGARLSDHGCQSVPASFCEPAEAARIFDAAMQGRAASPEELEKFSTFMLLELARMDHARGWTNQFHMGVSRNNNTRLFKSAGRDLGCDSIAGVPQGESLGLFLDRLDSDGCLPKTIVYNLNPSDNYLISTMIGNFQDGSVPGKLQHGSGWWFLDQQEGMEWQLNTVSNNGLLSRFVGMLTDSRSFMSMPRHEYFRRIACNLIGRDMEIGSLPNDFDLVGGLNRTYQLSQRERLSRADFFVVWDFRSGRGYESGTTRNCGTRSLVHYGPIAVFQTISTWLED